MLIRALNANLKARIKSLRNHITNENPHTGKMWWTIFVNWTRFAYKLGVSY